MSRGLGKVERKILEFLNDEEITKDMRVEFRHVSDIVEYVYYEKGIKFLDIIKRDGAPYQSVCRALRRLEQKGLIKSKVDELWNCKLIYPV